MARADAPRTRRGWCPWAPSLLLIALLLPRVRSGGTAGAASWAALPLRLHRGHGEDAGAAGGARSLLAARQSGLRGSVNGGFYAVELNIGTPPQVRIAPPQADWPRPQG
jgi:hypothetical protein